MTDKTGSSRLGKKILPEIHMVGTAPWLFWTEIYGSFTDIQPRTVIGPYKTVYRYGIKQKARQAHQWVEKSPLVAHRSLHDGSY
jgi:hypothetical protein